MYTTAAPPSLIVGCGTEGGVWGGAASIAIWPDGLVLGPTGPRPCAPPLRARSVEGEALPLVGERPRAGRAVKRPHLVRVLRLAVEEVNALAIAHHVDAPGALLPLARRRLARLFRDAAQLAAL